MTRERERYAINIGQQSMKEVQKQVFEIELELFFKIRNESQAWPVIPVIRRLSKAVGFL